MDESWLPIADAAAELGLSASRVRELVASGALAGWKLGGLWFIDPAAVQRRSGPRKSGRPLSANNAWRLLGLLGRPKLWLDDPARAVLPFPASPVERYRLRSLLADLPDADGLASRLSRRAEVARMRVHPGIVQRLFDDARVSVGAGRAVAARGGGVASGGLDRIYVAERDLADLVGKYRLRNDIEGDIELAAVPEEVDQQLRPAAGEPVPLEVAWADLLDDPDSRARSAARHWAESLSEVCVVGAGR